MAQRNLKLDGTIKPAPFPQHVRLPFELPKGATRLQVEFGQLRDYQRQGDRTIYVTVFDSRDSQNTAVSFRGSTFKRFKFSIAEHEATPGFIRGPLQPGEWSIVLSCPPSQENPLSYTFHIRLEADLSGDKIPPIPMTRVSRLLSNRISGGAVSRNGGGNWFRGDLHAHSEHSDGANTVAEMVNYARMVGLDFFALTDHNTVSHWEELAQLNTGTPVLIAGEEVTMPGGHANVWGANSWIDFRTGDTGHVEHVLRDANARGSILSVNHPFSPMPWHYGDLCDYQAMEIWNGPWCSANEMALERWQHHLEDGNPMVAVGGSDSHCVPPAKMTRPNLPGKPCIWVYTEAPPTQKGILEAVEHGRMFISETPVGPFLELRADADGDGVFESFPGDKVNLRRCESIRFRLHYRGAADNRLLLFGQAGLLNEIALGAEQAYEEFTIACEGSGFVRAEVRGAYSVSKGQTLLALTNPIYWGNWSEKGSSPWDSNKRSLNLTGNNQ